MVLYLLQATLLFATRLSRRHFGYAVESMPRHRTHLCIQVNPFGVDFNMINKSDLLRVDHKGNILDHGKVKILNKAAFLIHGAIHEARPDVMCAAHTHSVYGRAFCALGKPLDSISLESCIFHKVSTAYACGQRAV